MKFFEDYVLSIKKENISANEMRDIKDMFLLTESESIHLEVVTRNGTFYPQESMTKIVFNEIGHPSGLESWTKPYYKPVLINHNQYISALGRVFSTEIGMENNVKFVKTYALITDEDAIAKILSGIYYTESIGSDVSEVRCSICLQDITKDFCGHLRFQKYEDGKLCYWIIKKLWFEEKSYVNIPSDGSAKTVGVQLISSDAMPKYMNLYATDKKISEFYKIDNGVHKVSENAFLLNSREALLRISESFTNRRSFFSGAEVKEDGGDMTREEKATLIKEEEGKLEPEPATTPTTSDITALDSAPASTPDSTSTDPIPTSTPDLTPTSDSTSTDPIPTPTPDLTPDLTPTDEMKKELEMVREELNDIKKENEDLKGLLIDMQKNAVAMESKLLQENDRILKELADERKIYIDMITENNKAIVDFGVNVYKMLDESKNTEEISKQENSKILSGILEFLMEKLLSIINVSQIVNSDPTKIEEQPALTKDERILESVKYFMKRKGYRE
ncbi:MAG: hypothetical protein DDT23_00333 [candidate division WS2 bacterium]|nr:hypothetical protein [Candidatus Lithacetigena glycinireducens]